MPALMGPVYEPGMPYSTPWATNNVLPQLDVVPVTNPDGTLSTTRFDITFVGASAKQDVPLLVAGDLLNDRGAPILSTAVVSTIKETSHEFRVNPPEYDNPNTPDSLDTADQSMPSVAMDGSGDFVIAWQGVVANSTTYGSITDVFERRYSPYGNRILDNGLVDQSVVVPDPVSADSVQLLTVRPGDNDAFTFLLNLANPQSGGSSGSHSVTYNGNSAPELDQLGRDISAALNANGFNAEVDLLPSQQTGEYQFEIRLNTPGCTFDFTQITASVTSFSPGASVTSEFARPVCEPSCPPCSSKAKSCSSPTGLRP